jgi:putative membrane protein
MKHSLLFAVSLAALSLAGCKKEAAPAGDVAASATPAGDAMAPAPGATAPASAAQTFVDAAAASDAFEIETSRLAATKAESAKVKRFAETMIKAHTDSTAKLKTAAAAASPALTPSPQLNATQQQTLDELSAKSGADFDRAYAKAQVDAHQMTLDTLKAYSTNGEVAPLKSFATELVPVVTAHLNMAKGL